MNKNLTATTAGTALLVVAALLAVVAVASPAPTQASGEAMPAVKVKDTGNAFIIRWTVPDGVEPTQQLVEAWTDDGYGRVGSTRYAFPADGEREAEISIDRDTPAGTAYGFRVSMQDGGRLIWSKDEFRYPNGPMAKRPPSGLTALWHHEQLRLAWIPGRNPNYVGQVAKCRPTGPDAEWTEVELSRTARKAVFRNLDSGQKYVCRAEARKANGHYQMSKSVNAKPPRVATPGDISLDHEGGGDVRFGWSLSGTAGVAGLLVQREGPLPEYSSRVYPGWQTLAELEPNATSYVDSIAVDATRKFYNYRVVAVGEHGGDTVGQYGVCVIMPHEGGDEDGEPEDWYVCGPAADWSGA